LDRQYASRESFATDGSSPSENMKRTAQPASNLDLSHSYCSCMSLREPPSLTRPRPLELVVFDVDGTLTAVTSVWQYLHERLGTWTYGRLTSSRYWRGEITYDEWAKLDAMMWRGRKLCEIAEIIERISYFEGVEETFSVLKEKGAKIAVVSAGLSLLVNRIVEELGADFGVANELVVEDGRLTGNVSINVSLSNKCQVIREVARNLGVNIRLCAVVGDYCYDIPNDAGLRVAFNPKDNTAEMLADVIVRSNSLIDILKHLV